MKSSCLLFVIFLLHYTSSASTYYFSSSAGDDNRTSAQARNPSTPWRSLSKLNSFFASLQPGDSVLLKRGDVFYGSITISRSGTSSDPIVISAYGSGAKPLITGFTRISSWVSKGGGIYESSSTLPNEALNMVLFNGQVQAMGRYPNTDIPSKGYLFFEAYSGGTSITDNELPASPSWTGAQAVVRANRWTLCKSPILSHLGGTLIFSSPIVEPKVTNGYFIQNHLRTLDQLGEWYYNPATKKLSVFFGSASPSSYRVQAATTEELFSCYKQNYITVDGLSLTGSNDNLVDIVATAGFTLRSCELAYAGSDAIAVRNTASVSLRIEGCTINRANNNAIDLLSPVNGVVIRGNTIRNTSLFDGFCDSWAGSSIGIALRGDNQLIENNVIDSTGYNGIRFTGSNVTIKNNLISNFNLIKDDGGGIYAFNTQGINRKVIGNIILDGIGAQAGTGRPGNSSSGIFLDDEVTGVEVSGNTIARCAKAGIYIRNCSAITLRDNTLFDNGRQLTMVHDIIAPTSPLRNLTVKNNIYFAKTASQRTASVHSIKDDLNQLGILDSNYYCRPVDEDMIIESSYINDMGQRINGVWDLKGWQGNFMYDKNARRTGRQLPSYIIRSLLSDNLFDNGRFDKDISGLNATATTSWIRSKLDGGTLQAEISPNGGQYQIVIGVGAIEASKNYVLRFSALSTQDTVFNVYLRQSRSPYTRLIEAKSFKVDAHRSEYEFIFSRPAGEDNASIVFDTRAKDLKFWLDNVQLYEADATIYEPQQRIRFEYNPTNDSKVVRLRGNYVDIKNKAYSSTVTLRPYSSIILLEDMASNHDTAAISFKQPSYAIGSEPKEIVNLKERISTSDSTSVSVKLTASDEMGFVPAWLNVDGKLLNGISQMSDSEITFTANATGLPAGEYTARIIASAPDYKGAVLDIRLNVGTEKSFTTLKVNFQDSATTTPAGWLADFGQPFGPRTLRNQGIGKTYGWINKEDNSLLDLVAYGRNRLTLADTTLSTLVHMQGKGTVEGVWEAKVADGTYDVTVSAGDDSYTDSRHTITVEGVPAIVNFVPTFASKFKTATVSVIVTDGLLTVDAVGGINTKINYISIQPSTNQRNMVGSESEEATSVDQQQTLRTVTRTPETAGDGTASVLLSIRQVYPNPARTHFNLAVNGNSNLPLTLYLYDLSGKLLESKNNIAANGIIQAGYNLPRGSYVVQVVQGTQKAQIKVVKL